MQGLDTSTLPRRERADAVTTHMREIALASRVVLDDPEAVFLSTEVFRLGRVELVHTKRSGMFMDVRRERDDHAPVVAMMLGSGGGAREQFDHIIQARSGVVDLIELTRPHRSWIRSSRHGWCIKVPVDALDLPVAMVTRARPALESSPLHHLFASHLKLLSSMAADLERSPAADQVGAATVALARALIISAVEPDALAGTALHESLVPRVQVFVREHLKEPDLSPQRIASAHHVSVRLLYRELAAAGLQLEQWVIDQRLEGARLELASVSGRRRKVSAVAQQWGFSSPSHFSRRFSDKFGVTPREWQRSQD